MLLINSHNPHAVGSRKGSKRVKKLNSLKRLKGVAKKKLKNLKFFLSFKNAYQIPVKRERKAIFSKYFLRCNLPLRGALLFEKFSNMFLFFQTNF
jgi:hypothetical protein